MKFSILLSLAAMIMSPLSFSQQNKQYVSLDAWDMGIERVDDSLFRWILFHPDSEFPCLRVETMESATRTLIEQKNICSVIDNETNKVFGFKNLTYIDIHDIRLVESRFMFEVELTPLESTKVVLISCGLELSSSRLEDLICKVDR
ncbi:hypothetical protein VINI7043_16108 [Vibrio nigripulchritudo ATCC 27043]|uniref:hypothetical protein n=1 Tax=Vibrio nigripulchritudo TaxID=28173 RepID=UPI00021C2987|nr:hypothetical protein [Vibrio nigripulchritudo]EGU61600.1 hypothetical protein VINI7043_16108 [Vibrio nigripulchritudo ATCC 27043]